MVVGNEVKKLMEKGTSFLWCKKCQLDYFEEERVEGHAEDRRWREFDSTIKNVFKEPNGQITAPIQQ